MRGAAVALVFLLAGGPLSADAPAGPKSPLDKALEKARSSLVGRLSSVASWTEEKQLGGLRHRIYRMMLVFAPDNPRARSGLEYTRASKTGPWVQAADYREPSDWNKENLPAGQKRLKDALVPYRDAVLAALDAQPDLAPERRMEETERLIDLLPDDPGLRGARGDVEHAGRWVLPETPEGERKRAEWVRLAATHWEAAQKIVDVDPEGKSRNWDFAYRSPRRGLYGDLDREMKPAELIDAYAASRAGLVATEAADAMLVAFLGGKDGVRGPSITYSFPDKESARRWLETRPEYRTLLPKIERFSGLYLPSGDYVSRGLRGKDLRVVAIRHTVEARLDDRFPGRARGWITEGIGQRFVWYVTQMHGRGFVSVATTDQGAGAAGQEPAAPKDPAFWLSAAAAVLDPGPARLAGLLTMQLNAMESSDALLAYGLAAYLLEARPEAFVAFTEATTKGDEAKAMVHDVFGVDIATFAWRLRRWLKEAR